MAFWLRGPEESQKETVVLNKIGMTFDWASAEEGSPSTVSLDGQSEGSRMGQQRPSQTRLDGGWAWMGMDGLVWEPSRFDGFPRSRATTVVE